MNQICAYIFVTSKLIDIWNHLAQKHHCKQSVADLHNIDCDDNLCEFTFAETHRRNIRSGIFRASPVVPITDAEKPRVNPGTKTHAFPLFRGDYLLYYYYYYYFSVTTTVVLIFAWNFRSHYCVISHDVDVSRGLFCRQYGSFCMWETFPLLTSTITWAFVFYIVRFLRVSVCCSHMCTMAFMCFVFITEIRIEAEEIEFVLILSYNVCIRSYE